MHLDKTKPIEWQCPVCGQWVDDAWSRHCHVKEYQPSMGELHAMRAAHEANLEGIAPDVLEKATVETHYRTGREPQRNKVYG